MWGWGLEIRKEGGKVRRPGSAQVPFDNIACAVFRSPVCMRVAKLSLVLPQLRCAQPQFILSHVTNGRWDLKDCCEDA